MPKQQPTWEQATVEQKLEFLRKDMRRIFARADSLAREQEAMQSTIHALKERIDALILSH